MLFRSLGWLGGTWGKDKEALVGLTLITDIRKLESERSTYFLKETYTSKSMDINFLIDQARNDVDFTFGTPIMDANFISFVLSPRINACFRMNRGDSMVNMILNKHDCHAFLKYCRDLQNVIAKTIESNLSGYEFSDLVYMRFDVEKVQEYSNCGFKLSNFVGLCCSSVVNKFSKTSIVEMYSNGVSVRASLRGIRDADYLTPLSKLGISAAGHMNAFGIKSMNNVDLHDCNDVIAKVQAGYTGTETVVEVSAFLPWTKHYAYSVASKNIYCRGAFRTYVKFTGESWTRHASPSGKMYTIVIDDIEIKCFDKELTPNNAYIMPMLDRGYVTYYMHKILG